MDRSTFEERSPRDRSATCGDWPVYHVFAVFGGVLVRGDVLEMVSSRTSYGSHVRLAQQRRRFRQGVQHFLQIEGRAADDLEDVSGGRLLLERFEQLTE